MEMEYGEYGIWNMEERCADTNSKYLFVVLLPAIAIAMHAICEVK